jgi:hypothetical protein
MNLPFRPWWWHPNHRYEGKHRGTYQYRPDQNGNIPTAIQYGIRSIILKPYIDVQGVRSQTIPFTIGITFTQPEEYAEPIRESSQP